MMDREITKHMVGRSVGERKKEGVFFIFFILLWKYMKLFGERQILGNLKNRCLHAVKSKMISSISGGIIYLYS